MCGYYEFASKWNYVVRVKGYRRVCFAFSGCFMCCMDNGLRIYYIEPLVEKVHYGKLSITVIVLVFDCFTADRFMSCAPW